MQANESTSGVVADGPTPNEAAADLLDRAGFDASVAERLTVTGDDDPFMPSVFRVGAAAATTIGAASLATTEIWRERTGQVQTVALDRRHAAGAYVGENFIRVHGELAEVPAAVTGDFAGIPFLQTGDGRWVRVHLGQPRYHDAAQQVLGCEDTMESAREAAKKWPSAAELEKTLVENGAIATMVLRREEWAEHPQGKIIVNLPLFLIEKIADSDPMPFSKNPSRPLEGIRVMDMTSVIAGPTCCKFLGQHGADVIRMTAPNVRGAPRHVMNTGFGKLSAHLDLREAEDLEKMGALLDGADVLVQGLRPGVLASYGFGPEAAAERRPGIIYLDLSAYGHTGPWAERPGYDTMLQSSSGMADEEGSIRNPDGSPAGVPTVASDYSTGYIAALAIQTALLRRAREGGSWHIRVALAATNEWLQNFGRVRAEHYPEIDREAFTDYFMVSESPFGTLQHLRIPEQLSETQPFWARTTAPYGTHPAVWK